MSKEKFKSVAATSKNVKWEQLISRQTELYSRKDEVHLQEIILEYYIH